ncbi:MAG: hypothetical protein M0Q53_09815 [Prolixibacteraceae bacterium]|jgi:hypothetical protein|nr:hypothetical protein [Prolixibacteraceae bacterium]
MSNLKITKKVTVSGDMEIYLDEKMLGVVSDCETKLFDVPIGQHKIRAKLRYFGSAENSFMFTEHALALTVKDRKWLNYFSYIYATLLMILLLFRAEIKFSEIHMIFLGIPPLLVFIYAFTIGRNKRMIIVESKLIK